jgi:hypothetical protein
MSKYMYLQACVYEKKLYIAVEALKKFFDFFRKCIGETASAEEKRQHITPPSD